MHVHPLKCVYSEIFVRRGVVRKFVDKTTITRLLFVNIGVYIFRMAPKKAGFSFCTDKHMNIY